MEKNFLNFIDRNIESVYKSSALELGSKLFILIMIMLTFDVGAYALPGFLRSDHLMGNVMVVGVTLSITLLTIIGFLLRKSKKCLDSRKA